MRCTAKYIGKTTKFGVNPGEFHEISLNTYETAHGSPHIWIQTLDSRDYLMPFASVSAMLNEWAFIAGEERTEFDQRAVEEDWMKLYVPGGTEDD